MFQGSAKGACIAGSATLTVGCLERNHAIQAFSTMLVQLARDALIPWRKTLFKGGIANNRRFTVHVGSAQFALFSGLGRHALRRQHGNVAQAAHAVRITLAQGARRSITALRGLKPLAANKTILAILSNCADCADYPGTIALLWCGIFITN
jgi:hypothetical protein